MNQREGAGWGVRTLASMSLYEIGLWVAARCVELGATPETAFKVAVVFVAGLRREGWT